MQERECVTHAKDVLTSFEGMKNDAQFCDFILKIGEEEIPVHRMVLAACSKYFHAMFSLDTKEAKTGRAEILGIEPSVGKQCLEFAYTGKIKFSRENPKDLIHAAEMMQLHTLIDLYFEYLVENISTKNCLEYMVLALTYNQSSFAKIFVKFLAKNFAQIIKTDDFGLMSQVLLAQCIDSLRDGTQSSEKLKWEAVTKWVKSDLENREDVFPELFKMIKLENLPTDFVKENVSRAALVRQSCELMELVVDGLSGMTRLTKTSESSESPSHIVALHKESRLLVQYDMNAKKWSRLARVPANMTGDFMDVVSKEGEIFAGTGSMLSKYHDGVWTKLLTTGHGSHYCRCVVGGPFIFMVTSRITVKYDTRNNTFDKTDTGCGLGNGFAIAVSNDWLYAVGGQGTPRVAKEFDITTKTWEPIANMNVGRIDGAIAFFGGRLLAVGGNYCFSTEYYNPSADKWISLSNTGECSFSRFKVHIIGEKLYAIKNDTLEAKELDLDYKTTKAFSTNMDFPHFCTARLV